MEIAAMKRNKASEEADVKFAAELKGLTQTAEISKIKAVQVASELKIKQTEWSSKSAELEAQITALETQKKRDAYANAKPVYLDNPLKADGTSSFQTAASVWTAL